MENYQPNSKKSKEEKKKLDKVISGSAKTKKKSEVKKFADAFMPEDLSGVTNYIIVDVLIPGLKRAISDIVDICLYGEVTSKKKRSESKVNYQGFYDSPKRRSALASRGGRYGYDFEEIILEDRIDAENVLQVMDELIDSYGKASVGDLYDLVGITGDFTDYNFGWKNLSAAEVYPVRGEGYSFRLPRVISLKD